MGEGDTLINALIGAVVSVFTGPFIPLSPIAGGASAAYLQGGDQDESLRIGVISGAIAFLPFLLFVGLLGSFLFTMMTGVMGAGMPMAVGGFGGWIVIVIALFAALYTIGLSAIGGFLGHYLKHESDVEL